MSHWTQNLSHLGECTARLGYVLWGYGKSSFVDSNFYQDLSSWVGFFVDLQRWKILPFNHHLDHHRPIQKGYSKDLQSQYPNCSLWYFSSIHILNSMVLGTWSAIYFNGVPLKQPSSPPLGDPAGGQSKDGPIPIACVDVSDVTWPGILDVRDSRVGSALYVYHIICIHIYIYYMYMYIYMKFVYNPYTNSDIYNDVSYHTYILHSNMHAVYIYII